MEPKENALAKQKELQMQREVEEIVSRTSLVRRLKRGAGCRKQERRTAMAALHGGRGFFRGAGAGYSAEVPFDEGRPGRGADNREIPPRRLAENGGAGLRFCVWAVKG